jgi:hypothetical protein
MSLCKFCFAPIQNPIFVIQYGDLILQIMVEIQNAYVETDSTGLAKSTEHAKEVADKIDYANERAKLADQILPPSENLNMDPQTVTAVDLTSGTGILQIIAEQIDNPYATTPGTPWSMPLSAIAYKNIFTLINKAHEADTGLIWDVNVINEGDIVTLTNGILGVKRADESRYASFTVELFPKFPAAEAEESAPASSDAPGLIPTAPAPADTAPTGSTTTEASNETAPKEPNYAELLTKDTWTKAEAIASTLLVKDSDGKNYTSLYGWEAADKNAWDKGTNYKLVPHWETFNGKISWTKAEAVFSGFCVKINNKDYYPKEGYTYHKAKGDDYKIYALPSTEANEQGPAKVDTQSPNLERNNHRLIQDKIKTEFGKEEGDCSVSLEKDNKQTISFPIAYKGYDLGQIKVEKKDGGKWSIGSMEYDTMIDAANDAVLARKAITYVLTNKIAPEAGDEDDPFYAMPVLSQLGFAAEGRDMQVTKEEYFGGKLSIKGDSSEFVDDINKRYSEYVQKTELFDKETWSFEEAVDSELTYTKEKDGVSSRYAKPGYKWAEVGNKDNMKVLPDSFNPSPEEALADNSVNWMLRVAESEIGLKWKIEGNKITFLLNGDNKATIERNNGNDYWEADGKKFGDLKLAIIKTASKVYDEDRLSQVDNIYERLNAATPFAIQDGAVKATSNNEILWEPIFKQNNVNSMYEKLTAEYRRIEASKKKG